MCGVDYKHIKKDVVYIIVHAKNTSNLSFFLDVGRDGGVTNVLFL